MSEHQNETHAELRGYSGRIPGEVIMALHREAHGVHYGVVTLELHVLAGKLQRFSTDRKISHHLTSFGEERE